MTNKVDPDQLASYLSGCTGTLCKGKAYPGSVRPGLTEQKKKIKNEHFTCPETNSNLQPVGCLFKTEFLRCLFTRKHSQNIKYHYV